MSRNRQIGMCLIKEHLHTSVSVLEGPSGEELEMGVLSVRTDVQMKMCSVVCC